MGRCTNLCTFNGWLVTVELWPYNCIDGDPLVGLGLGHIVLEGATELEDLHPLIFTRIKLGSCRYRGCMHVCVVLPHFLSNELVSQANQVI